MGGGGGGRDSKAWLHAICMLPANLVPNNSINMRHFVFVPVCFGLQVVQVVWPKHQTRQETPGCCTCTGGIQ